MVTVILRGNVACGTGLCNTFVKLRTCDYWLLWKSKKIKKTSGSLWAALGSLRGSFAETLGGNMGQDGAKSEDESRWSQQSSAVSLSVFALSPGGAQHKKSQYAKLLINRFRGQVLGLSLIHI